MICLKVLKVLEKIISKNIDLKNETYSNLEISILSDYESYMIASDSSYLDLSDNFTDLGFSIINNQESIDTNIINTYINGLEKILCSTPILSNDDKYKNVACWYIHFVQGLVVKEEKYSYLLKSICYIVNSIESRRTDNYKPLLTGRIYMNFTYITTWPSGLGKALIEHFNQLTDICIDSDNKDSIVNLYSELISSLGFGIITTNELIYYFNDYKVNNHEYSKLIELSNYIEETLNNESLTFDYKKIKEIAPASFTQKKGDDDDILKSFENKINDYNFQKMAFKNIHIFISKISKYDTGLLIDICELKNPMSSEINMLTCELLPNSIQDIFNSLISLDRDDLLMSRTGEMHNQYLIKGLSMLFIYKVCVLVKDDSSTINLDFMSKYKLSDLDKINNLLKSISDITSHLVNHQKINDLCLLHSLAMDKVKDKRIEIIEIIEIISNGINKNIDELKSSGKLSHEKINTFLNSFPKDKNVIENHEPLLKKLLISKNAKFKHTSSFKRTTFIDDPRVHTIFDNIGQSVINGHFDLIYNYIYENTESLNADTTWPINYQRLVLLPWQQIQELKKYGFSFKNNHIYWPDGSSSPYKQIQSSNQTIKQL